MSTATRVLIVEDKIVVANNLQDRLQRMGYAILGIVPSGEAAIRSVMELEPDIVLMDIRLKGEMDGIQAAQEIRAGCDVPIVYLTGHADEPTLQRARLTEPYGYLLKPFDALGLRSTIEMALYRHAAERKIKESEEKYRRLSDKLERRVEARTADLARANLLLEQEVAERRQAEEALRRRNRELALLNRVISATATSQDVTNILQVVCKELALALDLSHASAALTDERMVQATVAADFPTSSVQPSLLGRTIAVEDNPALLEILQQEAPLVVDLDSNDPRIAPLQELMCDSRRASLLILPLCTDGALVGGLGLCTRESRPFSDQEVDLARRVAEQVSGLLARVRLAETQHRLSTAVEQTADATLIFDDKGSIIYVNPAFERATGYSRAEVLGLTQGLLRSDWHEEVFYQTLEEVIAAGQVWQGRLISKRKDGTLFPTDATVTPLRNPMGEVVSVVATLRDATREAQLEEQVRHAQKMEAIGQLAGGIAHDFNNLLTVIHMSGTILQRQLHGEDPLLEYVEHIQSTTRRAANLTGQLLNFSRREVDRQQSLELNQIIDDLDWMLRRLVGNDVKLVKSLDRDLRPVQADPSQFEQMVVNLVMNARDAMPEGGTLTIETANVILDEAYAAKHLDARPGPHIVLTVSDTGDGMDDEVKAHIFEPFFTTKKRGEGTGLGLTTVYGIVKRSGGHILVDSRVGQGTTFQVFLPSENGAVPSAEPGPAAVPDKASMAQTILVVEDEELVRNLTARILASRGYQVHVAGSGPEALQLGEQCSDEVHLLLVDLKMPQMNGLEVAQRLRSRWPGMRVLYMSGYSTDTDVVRQALDEGTPFLPKPFDLATLLEKIQAALDDE